MVTVATNAGLGAANGIAQWPLQNFAIAPMALATCAAAIFIARPRVQALALIVQIAGWTYYFAALQTPLTG